MSCWSLPAYCQFLYQPWHPWKWHFPSSWIDELFSVLSHQWWCQDGRLPVVWADRDLQSFFEYYYNNTILWFLGVPCNGLAVIFTVSQPLVLWNILYGESREQQVEFQVKEIQLLLNLRPVPPLSVQCCVPISLETKSPLPTYPWLQQ